MYPLFERQNWIDLYQDDQFSTIVFLVTLVLVLLALLLYSDRLRQWVDERRERAKWDLWNPSPSRRPKP